MKHFTEIAEQMRNASAGATPSELAKLVLREAERSVGEFYLANVFAEAFPKVPLNVLMRASHWHGVSEGGMSDERFDSLLSPYLNSSDPSAHS